MEKKINDIKVKQRNLESVSNKIRIKKGYGEGDNRDFIKLVKKNTKNDNKEIKKW